MDVRTDRNRDLRHDNAADTADRHQLAKHRDDDAPVCAPPIVQIDNREAREQGQQAGQIEQNAGIRASAIMLSYMPRLIGMPSVIATNVGPLSLARNNERSMLLLRRRGLPETAHHPAQGVLDGSWTRFLESRTGQKAP